MLSGAKRPVCWQESKWVRRDGYSVIHQMQPDMQFVGTTLIPSCNCRWNWTPLHVPHLLLTHVYRQVLFGLSAVICRKGSICSFGLLFGYCAVSLFLINVSRDFIGCHAVREGNFRPATAVYLQTGLSSSRNSNNQIAYLL